MEIDCVGADVAVINERPNNISNVKGQLPYHWLSVITHTERRRHEHLHFSISLDF